VSQRLTSIGDYPATCQCGWSGTVDECIPDVDGRGNLGCPKCEKVINVIVKVGQKKPGPSETKADVTG
jgi:hypothetical protein